MPKASCSVARDARADLMRGKNKPTFTPHVDCGDFVWFIKAATVKLRGRTR